MFIQYVRRFITRIPLRGTRLHRLRNDLRQMSWGIFVLGLIFATLGLMGVIDGDWPYLVNPLIFNSRLADLHQELADEFLGIGITVIVIDFANRWREIQQEKRRLIAQMGSRALNEDALRAVEELERTGRLEDGSLQGANFVNAELQGADLAYADLQGANLWEPNLQGANLIEANLQGVDLRKANLQAAELWSADLQEARLGEAKLQGASFGDANLRGAILGKAMPKGGKLRLDDLPEEEELWGATFDVKTTLPDFTQWTPNTDMDKFTDPPQEPDAEPDSPQEA